MGTDHLSSLPPARLADHLRVTRQRRHGPHQLGPARARGHGARARPVTTQRPRLRSWARVRSTGTRSRHGERSWAGVRVTSLMTLSGPRTRARPAAPWATTSTGSRDWRDGLTEVDGRMRPQWSTERLIVVDVDLAVTGERAQVAQGRRVCDPAQHDRGAEEREESVGRLPPARPGLGQILQAGQDQQPLPGALTHHGRQVGDGSDVGDLVEGQQRGWAVVVVRAIGRRSHLARRRCWRPRAGRIAVGGARPSTGRACSAPNRTRRSRAAGCSWTPWRPRCGRRPGRPMRWTRCPIAPSGRSPRSRTADPWRPRRGHRGSRGPGRHHGGRSSAGRPAWGVHRARRHGSGSREGHWRARSNGVRRSADPALSLPQPWRPP